MENSFSLWYRWDARCEYSGIAYPGIYIVSISNEDISGLPFTFRSDIVYIGMTNAVAGLRGRLVQFDNTIAKKHCQHGGADRFLYKHQDYVTLAKSLYVALRHFECKPARETPSDLRAMGSVVSAEYECMAYCVEKFDRLPEFNRKKESPKYSLTYGRCQQSASVLLKDI
jgi:hypothetical protein